MRNFIICFLLSTLCFISWAQIRSGNPCEPGGILPICTEQHDFNVAYPAITRNDTTGNDMSAHIWLQQHGISTCLYSQPNGGWYLLQIAHPGDLLIFIEQHAGILPNGQPDPTSSSRDVDFACWGPFNAYSLEEFTQNLCNDTYTLSSGNIGSHRPSNGNHSNDMGGYPVNSNPNNPYNIALIDCSYNAAPTEWCFIPNAQQGDWYLLLVCNYGGQTGYFGFQSQSTGITPGNQATTNCDWLNCLETNNITPCQGSNFTLYCTMDNNTLPSDVQYQWIAPDGTVLATTTDSSYVVNNVDPSMSGLYELALVGTTPERHGFCYVTVLSTPAPITASETFICMGDSVILSTPYNENYTGAYDGFLRWYFQNMDGSPISTDTSVVVFPTEDCQYILGVKDGYSGCSNSDTINIYVGQDVATEFTINTAEDCYVWNEMEYCESGDYVQTLQSMYGCDSVVTLHLNVSTGVDQYAETAFQVSPNPTNDIVNIQLGIEHRGKTVSLVDMHGKVLKTIPVKDLDTTISLSGYANGVYLLKLTDSNNHVVAVHKVVKR